MSAQPVIAARGRCAALAIERHVVTDPAGQWQPRPQIIPCIGHLTDDFAPVDAHHPGNSTRSPGDDNDDHVR
jgi:hypothetical protein